MNKSQTETNRLEAFSDGVFAIAITLLVLNLVVPTVAQLNPPGGTHVSLQQYLFSPNQLHVYVAYLISFLTVLMMWAGHHTMFTLISRTNQPFLIVNGVLLLFVTLIPFPTGLIATFFGQTPDGIVAVAVYAGTFFAIALMFNVVAWYAFSGNRLTEPDAELGAAQRRFRLFLIGPLMYLAAIGCAFINVYISATIFGGMTIFYALPLLTNQGLEA